MNIRIAFIAVVSILNFLSSATLQADSDSYFRQKSGIAADKQPLPDEFETREQLLWKQELLPGNSTPCVYGNSIFLTTYDADKKQLATVALDRSTGKIRWTRIAPTEEIELVHQVGSPASCSPACDGKRLYVFFGSYGMLCYNLDGKLLWEKKMGPFQDEFGAASSPVLVEGKVILNEDHDIDNFLIALDQKTGNTIWKTPREGSTRSYSSPVVWEHNGEKQIVVAGSLQLTAYDVKTGKRIWWVNGLSRIVDTTPAIADGLLYVATWTPGGDQTSRIAMGPFPDALKEFDKNKDNKIAKEELTPGAVLTRFFRIDLDQDGKLDRTEWEKHSKVFELAQNVALAVKPGGKGDVTKTHVKWIHRRDLPTVPSPLVYEGVLYLVKDGGILSALDAKSGKLLRRGRLAEGSYYASPVAGDGKIFLASERGVLTVLKASGQWEPLSAYNFGERIMATPVIADGKFYLRTDNALYCFTKQ